MSQYTWAVWMSVGVVVFIIELVATTYYLLWAGVAALCAGLLALIFPEQAAWLPWLGFAVIGVVLLWLTLRYLPKLRGSSVVPSNVDAMIGRQGLVIEAIDPGANTGRVRIESEEWRARCAERVEEGQRVEVKSVQGATLMVEKAEK